MSRSGFSRRTFLQGSVGLTVANFVPGTTPFAHAATMEEQTIAAAKAVGKADVNGMIWSPYLVPMKPVIAEFTKETGIGIGAVQDISIFDAPQRAMAEALSRSPQFDFIHIDSNMIPSLASAGYLEPLDEYIKKAGFHLDAVADYANFMKYGGQTYGVPTDGNVHIQYTRKDLIDNPDNKKRFADKFGTELKVPETWEDNLRLQEFLMDPSKDLLRVRQFAQPRERRDLVVHDFLQRRRISLRMTHSRRSITRAGQYAVDLYLQDKKVNHPEAATGAPADDSAHCARTRGQLSVLDGTCKTIANPKQSKPGQFYFASCRSKFTGKMVHRSISSPLAAILINKYSPRKAQAAYMALWLGSGKNSIPIVSDPVNAFNDAWAKEHMKAEPVLKAYTPEGIKAVETNFQVVSPPIYLTGYLEFQDALGKNLSEAYVGQLPAKDVLKKTENEWNAIIGRIGRAKLKNDLASYKAVMPTKAVPT
jgi:multiple sugar transport system substrate-binding protein